VCVRARMSANPSVRPSIQRSLFTDSLNPANLFPELLLNPCFACTYEGESKSFRNDRLKRELQMVQLSATRCSCIIFWASLVSFATMTL